MLTAMEKRENTDGTSTTMFVPKQSEFAKTNRELSNNETVRNQSRYCRINTNKRTKVWLTMFTFNSSKNPFTLTILVSAGT